MSKRGYISRYRLILTKIRRQPYCSFDELKRFMDRELEFLQMQDDNLNLGFSKRTFQRDLREIRQLFGLDIQYSRAQKGYYLQDSHSESQNFQRMMEAYDLFQSLNLAQDLNPLILLEQRRPQGTEHLYGLLHAIKGHWQVSFQYQKYWEDTPAQRTVEPQAMKEFRNRWYVLVKDVADGVLKTFALDRMSALEIGKQNFMPMPSAELETLYLHSFGIILPDDGAPDEILLSFDAVQGKYVQSLPLHSSQRVVKVSKKEVQIALTMHITFDFVMELLSMGHRVKVLEPESLRTQMKENLKKALERY